MGRDLGSGRDQVPSEGRNAESRNRRHAVHHLFGGARRHAALKRASGGLPNQLLRDVQAIHPNVTFADLPKELQDPIAESTRAAFTGLLKEGYAVGPGSRCSSRARWTGCPSASGRRDRRGPPRGPAAGHRRGGRRPRSGGGKPEGGGRTARLNLAALPAKRRPVLRTDIDVSAQGCAPATRFRPPACLRFALGFGIAEEI